MSRFCKESPTIFLLLFLLLMGPRLMISGSVDLGAFLPSLLLALLVDFLAPPKRRTLWLSERATPPETMRGEVPLWIDLTPRAFGVMSKVLN